MPLRVVEYIIDHRGRSGAEDLAVTSRLRPVLDHPTVATPKSWRHLYAQGWEFKTMLDELKTAPTHHDVDPDRCRGYPMGTPR